MPSIKFTDNELEFLRNNYEQELADAEMYISDLRKIISKLGKAEADNQPATPKKKRGRPAKVVADVTENQPKETTPEKKKRGRKPGSKNAKTAKKKAAKKAAAKKKAVEETNAVVTSKSLVAKNTDYIPKTAVKKIKEAEAVPVTVPAETPEQ